MEPEFRISFKDQYSMDLFNNTVREALCSAIIRWETRAKARNLTAIESDALSDKIIRAKHILLLYFGIEI